MTAKEQLIITDNSLEEYRKILQNEEKKASTIEKYIRDVKAARLCKRTAYHTGASDKLQAASAVLKPIYHIKHQLIHSRRQQFLQNDGRTPAAYKNAPHTALRLHINTK